MRYFSFPLVLAAALALSFASCKKESTVDATEDTGYATDYAQLDKSFSNAQDLADRAAMGTGGLAMKSTSQCATVTHDTISSPRVLTIDFGSTNCLCNDGKYRRGKIKVSYTGRYRDSGTVRTFSFDQYFINNNQLLGSKTVTNMGRNAQGQVYFAINQNDSMILANGNGVRSWTSTRTRTWTAGYNTPTWTDDEYDLIGTATLTRPNGKTFSIRITTPLHRALSCDWIESGVVEITPSGGSMRTLDFGSGGCDSNATLTVNGRTRSITLP